MNNIQLYVILALMAFSGLSALYRKVQEKRVISEAEANRRRQADEALRTGRDPGQAGNPARNLTDESIKVRRERELAEARAQQEDRLRQLREKISGQSTQAGGSSGSAGRPQSQPQAGQGVELWPGGPVVVVSPAGQPGQASQMPRPQAQPQPQQRQQSPQPARPAQPQRSAQPQRPQPQARPQQGRAATPARQQQQQQRPQVQTQQRSRDDATPKVGRASMTDRAGTLAMTRRAEVEQAAESKAVELRRTNELENSGRILPQTLAQWRSALVANEVLGVPMGLR